eukprot:UN06689
MKDNLLTLIISFTVMVVRYDKDAITNKKALFSGKGKEEIAGYTHLYDVWVGYICEALRVMPNIQLYEVRRFNPSELNNSVRSNNFYNWNYGIKNITDFSKVRFAPTDWLLLNNLNVNSYASLSNLTLPQGCLKILTLQNNDIPPDIKFPMSIEFLDFAHSILMPN